MDAYASLLALIRSTAIARYRQGIPLRFDGHFDPRRVGFEHAHIELALPLDGRKHTLAVCFDNGIYEAMPVRGRWHIDSTLD